MFAASTTCQGCGAETWNNSGDPIQECVCPKTTNSEGDMVEEPPENDAPLDYCSLHGTYYHDSADAALPACCEQEEAATNGEGPFCALCDGIIDRGHCIECECEVLPLSEDLEF